MFNEIVGMVITSIIAGLFVVFMHELGHFLAARKYKLKARIVLSNKGIFTEFPANVDNDKRKLIYESGIMMGFVGLLLITIVNVVYIFYLVPYLIGTRDDRKELKEIGNS